jgi:hypothetical protein
MQVTTLRSWLKHSFAPIRSSRHRTFGCTHPIRSTHPSGTGGIIGSTPFLPPLATPSTGMRTKELHGPGYYHIGSPADQGYAEHMRFILAHRDKTLSEMSHHPWVHLHEDRVVRLVRAWDGRADRDSLSKPFKEVELSRLAEWIQGIPRSSVCSSSVKLNFPNSRRRI